MLKTSFEIIDYSPEYRSSIRKILTKIGWAEQYIFPREKFLRSGWLSTWLHHPAILLR